MTIQPALALAWNPAVGVPLAVVGAIVLALIWLFGQPKKEQGKRRILPERGGERREPTLGEDDPETVDDAPFSALDGEPDPLPPPAAGKPSQGELDMGLREELQRLGATLSDQRGGALSEHDQSIESYLRQPSPDALAGAEPRAPAASPLAAAASAPAAPKVPKRSDVGRRPAQLPVERIVSLFVVAREGSHFNGADLVVAAEKAGLEFGDMGIYHRLLDGKRELGPVFSVANMVKPGSFDLSRVDVLRTPGLSFFMTLPAPVSALDAWDAMLPTAQRLAELLDGQVLDEERNALGRQRIAHIRDELRGWDRGHDGEEVVFRR